MGSEAATPKGALEAYLCRLPDGLDSYPDCVVKGSVVREFLEGHDMTRLRARLPAPLGELATPGSAVVTRWLPEVHFHAAMLAVTELFFDSDEAFIEDAYQRNRRLLAGPLYRMLTKFLSVDRIGSMGRMVFHQLHRGIELEYRAGDPARWALHYPPHLLPELVARCYAGVSTLAIELGGDRVRTEVISHGPELFLMEIHRCR